jgi:hypothetical protein
MRLGTSAVCIALAAGAWGLTSTPVAAATIIDHNHTRIGDIPVAYINAAKTTLRIAYGHTSHGSQLITGMNAVRTHYGATYSWDQNGAGGALRLADGALPGDLGAPNRTAWAAATRTYLAANPLTNVIIWSWCGQVDGSEADINTYLNLMNQLERDYPNVKFVYMTGHLDGSGAAGNVNVRNAQIRNFVRANNKILFDFADIESYDPDRATHYMPLRANDNCDYDSDNNGTLDRNWASRWVSVNPSHELTGLASRVGSGSCAHSQPLNCAQKGGAAWLLWARLAGWAGPNGVTLSVDDQATAEGNSGATTADFTVSLSGTATVPVTVNWATANGTARAGEDYVAGSGALTFGVGDTQQTVTVTVNGDTTLESDETYRVVLSGAVNATIADGDGLGTITNDDAGTIGKGFHPLPPCRLVDTRETAQGPALAATTDRLVTIASTCGIPANASAVSLNTTVVGATNAGYLTLYPAGTARPLSSTINFGVSQTRANNAIVKVGASGQISVFGGLPSGTTHVILDVAGYFDQP